MANPDDIDLGIKVTGAQAAVDDLKKVEDASKEVADAASNPMSMPSSMMGPERTDEVREQATAVKKLAAETKAYQEQAEAASDATDDIKDSIKGMGETSDTVAPKMDKIMGLQKAQIAIQVAEGIGRLAESARNYSKDMKGLDDQSSKTWGNVADGMDMAVGALNLGAQGFAVGGPFGAAVGALVGLMAGPLMSTFKDVEESQKRQAESAKAATKATQDLKDVRAALALESRKKDLENAYRRELDLLQEQTSEIERQASIKSAQVDTAMAVTQNAASKAVRGGAGETGVDAAVEEAKSQAEIDKLEIALNAMRERLGVATDVANSTASKAAAWNEDGMHTQEEIDSASEAAAAAQAALRSTTADFQKLEQITQEQVSQIQLQLETKLTELNDANTGKLESFLSKLVQDLSSRSSLDASTKAALQELQQVMKDGVVKPDEIRAVETAMGLLKSSNSALFESVLKGVGTLVSDQRTMEARIQELFDLNAARGANSNSNSR